MSSPMLDLLRIHPETAQPIAKSGKGGDFAIPNGSYLDPLAHESQATKLAGVVAEAIAGLTHPNANYLPPRTGEDVKVEAIVGRIGCNAQNLALVSETTRFNGAPIVVARYVVSSALDPRTGKGILLYSETNIPGVPIELGRQTPSQTTLQHPITFPRRGMHIASGPAQLSVKIFPSVNPTHAHIAGPEWVTTGDNTRFSPENQPRVYLSNITHW